jgi:hypothetical protein
MLSNGASDTSKDAVEIDRSRTLDLVLLDWLLRSLNRCPQALVLGRKPLDLFDMHVFATRWAARSCRNFCGPTSVALGSTNRDFVLLPHAKKLLFRATFERPNAW